MTFVYYYIRRIVGMACNFVAPKCGTSCCGKRSLRWRIRCPQCKMILDRSGIRLHGTKAPEDYLRFIVSDWIYRKRRSAQMLKDGVRHFPPRPLKVRLGGWIRNTQRAI